MLSISGTEADLVDGEARAHALELRVPRVTEGEAAADLLVEVLHVALRRPLRLLEGKVVLELGQSVAADGDPLVEERALGVDRDVHLRGRLRRLRLLVVLV